MRKQWGWACAPPSPASELYHQQDNCMVPTPMSANPAGEGDMSAEFLRYMASIEAGPKAPSQQAVFGPTTMPG